MDREERTAVLPVELNQTYKEAMRKNLALLMKTNKMSQGQLLERLKRQGLEVGQGSLSQYLSGRKSIPLSVIVHLCDIFRISLAELVDEDFGGAGQIGVAVHPPQVYSDDLLQLIPYLGDKFVVDPADAHFSGYLQTYHVYLFPSLSDDPRVRTGTLRLQAGGPVCEAILEINTNKLLGGKPYIKVYRGCCIISVPMRAVIVLLTDQENGEFSVLNFRYQNLSTYPLDCRIACTLLNATGEEHPPAMQRLFLSRTRIGEEHIPLLQTHLYLNSAIVEIRREQLEALGESCEAYRSITDELLRINQPQSVYYLSEEDILSTAKRCLSKNGIPLRNPEDPAVNLFYTRIRAMAEHSRINKASHQADRMARRLLRSLGYFHDHDNTN